MTKEAHMTDEQEKSASEWLHSNGWYGYDGKIHFANLIAIWRAGFTARDELTAKDEQHRKNLSMALVLAQEYIAEKDKRIAELERKLGGLCLKSAEIATAHDHYARIAHDLESKLAIAEKQLADAARIKRVLNEADFRNHMPDCDHCASTITTVINFCDSAAQSISAIQDKSDEQQNKENNK